MKKIISLLLVIVVLGCAAMLLKKRKQSIKDTPTATPMTSQVQVVSPKTELLKQSRSFLAQLSTLETAKISSKLSGRIEEVLVSENVLVKQGELLVRVDDAEIRSSIQSLDVTLKAQEKDVRYTSNLHTQNRALFEVGGLALEKLEASEVAYAAKQATLAATRQKITALEVQLDYLNIKAPFTGTVGSVFSRKGALAAPGQPLLTLNSPGQKLIFSYVPGDLDIRSGQEVFHQSQKIGQITKLYSDAKNGLSVAEVGIDTPLERPHTSYLGIDVLVFKDTGCTVPLDALLHTDKGTQVMIHDNGQFMPLPVRVIAENRERALIEPCPTSPVAVAAEAKLSLLPGSDSVMVSRSDTHE
ncbi:MAG: efflux RND transporter periplasmic adaptor subunit [Gammaproteobacteria bacterium]|nr:efflux RND transporter periplasmic adaptor subunit [Gammaproteobacteria bacterium]